MSTADAKLAEIPRLPPRAVGWEKALVRELARLNAEPLEWGKSDCVTRVADVAKAMTGVDPMASLRGSYSSELGAARVMVARGCADVGELLASAFPEVAPAMARRGDVGVVPGPDGVLSAVVFEGADVSGAGRARTSRTRVVRAFKVG